MKKWIASSFVALALTLGCYSQAASASEVVALDQQQCMSGKEFKKFVETNELVPVAAGQTTKTGDEGFGIVYNPNKNEGFIVIANSTTDKVCLVAVVYDVITFLPPKPDKKA